MKNKLSKLKTILLLFILLLLFTYIKVYSYTETLSTSLSSNILRLHIIANSNSSSDQLFKLKCRDKIVEYINNNIDIKKTTKESITHFLSNNIDNLYQICNNLSLENNSNYSFNISLSNSYFPTKQYGKILVPNGNYDCLKIEIGNSNGNNWWCCLFPPLCFTENSTSIDIEKTEKISENIIGKNLSIEESDILLNSKTKPDIHLKFKLLEIFNTKIK